MIPISFIYNHSTRFRGPVNNWWIPIAGRHDTAFWQFDKCQPPRRSLNSWKYKSINWHKELLVLDRHFTGSLFYICVMSRWGNCFILLSVGSDLLIEKWAELRGGVAVCPLSNHACIQIEWVVFWILIWLLFYSSHFYSFSSITSSMLPNLALWFESMTYLAFIIGFCCLLILLVNL